MIAIEGVADGADVSDVTELVYPVSEGAVATVVWVEDVAAAEVDGFAEEVADDDVSLSRAHVLSFWHVYPKGQHESPHFGRLSSSLVVLSEFVGWAVTFCSWISHVIGWMKEQSDPSGQQIAELALSRLMQVDDDGQQKSAGNFEFAQRSNELGHEPVSRCSSANTSLDETAAAMVVVSRTE